MKRRIVKRQETDLTRFPFYGILSHTRQANGRRLPPQQIPEGAKFLSPSDNSEGGATYGTDVIRAFSPVGVDSPNCCISLDNYV